MDFYAQLKNLISSQNAAKRSAAEILADLGTPTASIAILDSGIITSYCFSTVGDSSDTLFQACSISKPVAALAALRMVDRGIFRLEDSVSALLGAEVTTKLTADFTPSQAAMFQHITPEHLLSHTAGLTVHGFPGYPSAPVPNTALDILLAGKDSATLPVRLTNFPGQAFAYSGGGFTLLQLVMEQVAGRPFAELAREHVFEPLEMTSSHYGAASELREFVGHKGRTDIATARPHYTGYRPCEEGAHEMPELAAAGLWTTPADLLRAVRAIQQSLGEVGEHRKTQGVEESSIDPPLFLQPETARRMLTVVPNDVAMGLGWCVPHGGSVFQHSGDNEPGFTCRLIGYMEPVASPSASQLDERRLDGSQQRIPHTCGIAVMTNSREGDDVIWKLIHAIAYLKGWPEVPDILGPEPANIPFVAPARKEGLDGGQWRDWLGTWAGGNSRGQLKLDSDGEGRPTVSFESLPPVSLIPAALSGWKTPSDKASLDFVAEGLSAMLRLRTTKGERVVELCTYVNGNVTALKRRSASPSTA